MKKKARIRLLEAMVKRLVEETEDMQDRLLEVELRVSDVDRMQRKHAAAIANKAAE